MENRWQLQVTFSDIKKLYIKPIKNIKSYKIEYDSDKDRLESFNLLPGLFKNDTLLCVPSIKHGNGLSILKYPNLDSFLKFLT